MDSVIEHTKWNCRYHIVWAPKYRRKIIYERKRENTSKIMRVQRKRDSGGNACIDHNHMSLKIPPKYSAAQIMGLLKGKSSLMLFERLQNLKQKL